MKTFEQFKVWMKDHQAWDEFLFEYSSSYNRLSPKSKYERNPEYILSQSFTWNTSVKGLDFWTNLHNEWSKFYNTMKNYELIYVNEKVACVKMPKQATPVQMGFVKSTLQKENPEITDFVWEDGNLYGCVKKMELKKI